MVFSTLPEQHHHALYESPLQSLAVIRGLSLNTPVDGTMVKNPVGLQHTTARPAARSGVARSEVTEGRQSTCGCSQPLNTERQP